MLVACRLAGLSALKVHYADVEVLCANAHHLRGSGELQRRHLRLVEL
jgi:hypothetical protein